MQIKNEKNFTLVYALNKVHAREKKSAIYKKRARMKKIFVRSLFFTIKEHTFVLEFNSTVSPWCFERGIITINKEPLMAGSETPNIIGSNCFCYGRQTYYL